MTATTGGQKATMTVATTRATTVTALTTQTSASDSSSEKGPKRLASFFDSKPDVRRSEARPSFFVCRARIAI
jgi:hypothetical protein